MSDPTPLPTPQPKDTIVRVSLQWNTKTGQLQMAWPVPLKGLVLKMLATGMNAVIDYKVPQGPSILTPSGPTNGNAH